MLHDVFLGNRHQLRMTCHTFKNYLLFFSILSGCPTCISSKDYQKEGVQEHVGYKGPSTPRSLEGVLGWLFGIKPLQKNFLDLSG